MKTALVLTLCFNVLILISYTVCEERLVIDTDGGADDAAALLLILSAYFNNDSNFKVEAITCVHGNVDQKTAQVNVLKTLTIADSPNIPVYGGAEEALIEKTVYDHYFGIDGLGDFVFDDTISAKVDTSLHAVLALVQLAKIKPGSLNVLCLGPLTNIALAARMDPNFIRNVKKFYIIGASVSGVGNKSPGVEFNFAGDPESNFIVLNASHNEPSLLYPWEAALSTEISTVWRRLVFGSIKSKKVQFLNKAEAKSMVTSDFWTLADLFISAVMIWPELSTNPLLTNVTPVIDGAARGTVLVDYSNLTSKPRNVELVREINVTRLQRKLLRHFI